jgi:hypothetical protein
MPLCENTGRRAEAMTREPGDLPVTADPLRVREDTGERMGPKDRALLRVTATCLNVI